MEQPVIIIGAGLASWTSAREFRKHDTNTPVVLITQDSGDFYAKPSLSNAFAQGRAPAQLVSTAAAQMAETLSVRLLAHTQVTHIDRSARTLHTTHAQTPVLHYRDVVLATGAQAIRVPIAGSASAAVLSVNSLDDFVVFYDQLRATQGSTPRALTIAIMGAGLIGCEFANDLASAGHRVHVMDPSERPLAALLPAQASAQLHDALAAQGVQWHFNATVQAVDHGAPLALTLSNGAVLQADLVLSAIGLRAHTALAQAAGLACERGVVVNTQLQTSDPHIYALGDCAQYASAGARTLPFVMPIMQAAKALACTLAGTPSELVFPLMPVSIKTPALPLVVCPPAPGLVGQWHAGPDNTATQGLWRWLDAQSAQRGFVLSGAFTVQRMEQIKATQG